MTVHDTLLMKDHLPLVREAGCRALMLTPSAGTKLYEGTFTGGQVLDRAGGARVRPHMYDGNYVVASTHRRPWRKQLNLLAGYLYFYNPVWLAAALLRKKTKVSQRAAMMQVVGMLGLVQSFRRTSGWALRLMFGRIDRLAGPPTSRIPVKGTDGNASACHGPSEAKPVRSGRVVSLPVAVG